MIASLMYAWAIVCLITTLVFVAGSVAYWWRSRTVEPLPEV